MPPKPRITADMIAEAGLAVVRAEGQAALNIRSVARQLGCSTQPVMYHYSTAETLKAAIYAKADAFHSAYLMQEEPGDPLLGIGLRYIRFAAEESNLFRFLFQSGELKNTPLALLTASPDTVKHWLNSGSWNSTARWMAYSVPTFWTRHPTSAGSLLMGKSTPVTAWIRLRSPPCGYLVIMVCTVIFGLSETAICIA